MADDSMGDAPWWESSKGPIDSEENISGGFGNDDFRIVESQDALFPETPIEQPSLSDSKSFESDKIAREDTEDPSSKNSEFLTLHYLGSDEISVDSTENASRVFRSPLEPSVKREQPNADESLATEGIAIADGVGENTPWWESSKDSSHLEETASGKFPGNDFCAADDHDGVLGKPPAEQPFFGNSEPFESGNVVEGDTKDSSSKESEFPASHYRRSEEIPVDSSEHTFPEPDAPSAQTTADDLDVQHFYVDESGLSPAGSTEMPSEPRKSRKKVPRNIGSRRTSQALTQESKPKSLEQQHPPVFLPELICREIPGSAWQWEILLSVDNECRILEVRQDGESLDMVDGHYRPGSYSCPLRIVFDGDDQIEFPMFDGEPLIFKLKKGLDRPWSQGRRHYEGIFCRYRAKRLETQGTCSR